MKSKIIIPPSQYAIPQSYLDSISPTDTLEVKGKVCKDGGKTSINPTQTQ